MFGESARRRSGCAFKAAFGAKQLRPQLLNGVKNEGRNTSGLRNDPRGRRRLNGDSACVCQHFFFFFGWGSFRISRPENSSQWAQTVLIQGDDEMSASRVSGLILPLKRKTL